MGFGARFTSTDWNDHATKTKTKSTDQIFRSSKIDDSLNPIKIEVRESCDLDDNTPATPVMVFVDVTGSMGHLATEIVKNGLGIIMNEILDRKPISDPHMLIGAIGDAYSDRAPLQASQFEVSIDPIISQIQQIFIEGNGGGNGGESYLLALYFAAFKTKTDSAIKRNKKGYLFTIGDEPPHLVLTRSQIKTIFGDEVEADYTAKQLLDLATPYWEIFHLKVNPTRYSKDRWVDLLGERVIDVEDHTLLGELIVSTIQIIEGEDVKKVADSWSGDTSVAIYKATKDLTTSSNPKNGVVVL